MGLMYSLFSFVKGLKLHSQALFHAGTNYNLRL
uniref:Uncharacterized protein n=1 Tax=Arundo donax TaxID=35708 RepID=A0A0A8ZQI0_ARUDO